jgi:hypothetical protein
VFVLEVTGIGSVAVITWGTPGGTNHITDVRLLWRKEIRDDGSAFSYANLVASTGTSGGEITCHVTAPDGQVRENSRLRPHGDGQLFEHTVTVHQ